MDIYLIDGSSYVYRAYYAIKGLRDSRGRPTNAVFGFTNMLMKIIRDLNPGGIAICFDTPQATQRHELFGEYKAHRPGAPEEMVSQFPDIKRVIEAMRISVFALPGFEADDVLATLAGKISAQGHNVFIITADKDMLQLVGDGIKVYDPMKNAVLGREYVIEKFGVPPERVPEYMALVGDAVDNIPGVKGIGEKTARELFCEFASLDELIEHPERIKKERVRKMITEGIADIKLSRQLSILDRGLPVEADPAGLAVKEPDWRALLSLFKEFEFTSLMKLVPAGKAPPALESEVVLDLERLRELAGEIHGEFAIAIEPRDRPPMLSEIDGIALSRKKSRETKGCCCQYVPAGHAYEGAPPQIPRGQILDALKPLLEDASVAKIGHNLKHEVVLLEREGIEPAGPLYDTMVASHLLAPLRAGHGLEEVALEHLSIKKQSHAELVNKGDFKGVAVERAADFACQEAGLPYELRGLLFERLREDGLAQAYFEIEMPLIRVLARMELAGVRVDTGRLASLSAELGRELQSLEKRIFFLAGSEFNINSPRQLGHILFDVLKLTPGKKKKTGYSTELGVLEELAKSHDLPREILGWRALSKLKSTYVDVLPALLNPRTGRIHTSFNQAVTATGRLSSSDPNLQNIPIRGEWGRRVREAFIADPGSLIISADYSQIELRVLAHLSGDDALKNLFLRGADIHTSTAAEIFGVSPEKVTAGHRRAAKGINFGIIYGITPFGLSEAIGTSTEEAAKYIAGYFERHPGVKIYMQSVIEGARRDGFVRTMYGRKRYIPELAGKDARTRALGERLAMNSPIQGSAAEIIKKAMIRLSGALVPYRARLTIQVHDELVFECPAGEVPKVMEIIRAEMENAAGLDVPLKVDIGAGENWAAAHP